ncbi:hypothetical protein ACI4AF_29410, partial [Klebsiella pneumoniae]|uniref:hypothetical protein n=1 Tax=Klebsiella pneumoniae TaxID=573 RepID=UPI00385225E2
VATGNFFQLGTDSSTAGNTAADKAHVYTWAPVANPLTSTLLSAAFNTPLTYTNPIDGKTYTSGLTTQQYGGGDLKSTKPNVDDV